MVDTALLEAAAQAGRPQLVEQITALLSKADIPDEVLRRATELANQVKAHDLTVRLAHQLLLRYPQNTHLLLAAGVAAIEALKHDLAVMYLQQGLTYAVTNAEVSVFHSAIGRLWKDTARMDLCLHHFREAYRLDPTPDNCSNMVMALQYSAGAKLSTVYTQTAEFCELQPVPRYQHALDRLDPQRKNLRIGFVSGDFLAHSLAPLMLEIFRQFPRGRHELTFYQNRPESMADKVTAAYAEVGKLKYVKHLPDDELAKLIVEDRIDILVDLAGHTAENRLSVFLRKPAPVQMGWVSGMMSPPGISTIPYFLADKNMLTDEIRAACPEKLIELPSAYTYYPLFDAPVPAQPLDRGSLTFGCLNNPCKIHPPVLDAWAAILKQLPTARMHVKVGSTDNAVALRQEMAKRGVGERQVGWILPTKTSTEILQFYQQIDISLDPWPCTGMLTTLEAWWMGCPTVTMSGPSFLHRQSTSVFTHLDLPELIAENVDDYVRKAVALANNTNRLRELRATARDRLGRTVIRRPAELAAAVYGAFEWAWTDWCTSRQYLRTLRADLQA